jgi:hypothetical protein
VEAQVGGRIFLVFIGIHGCLFCRSLLVRAEKVGWLVAVGVTAILAIPEISLSFDNAVVNARVLCKMDEKWERVFLTIGILIPVFGLRLVFPILVVAVDTLENSKKTFTTHLSSVPFWPSSTRRSTP